MLDDAVAAFLDGITIERTFDEPFIALLRAEGFTEVTLMHGPFEMGKDIIASRDGVQWVFQTKAGDVGLRDFREIRNQLYDARMSDIAAPGFDTAAPRIGVLVTTGRLTGGAPAAAQEYRDQAARRGEPEVQYWTRDTLVGKFSGNADAVLRTSVDGQMLGLLGAIDERRVDLDAIEVFSRRWLSWDPGRMAGVGIVEAAIVSERLRAAERLDLAAQVALCAVRAGWVAAPESSAAAEAARRLFQTYGRLLWEACSDSLLEERGIVDLGKHAAWATYPVHCVRLAELLALYALATEPDDEDVAADMASWLARFVGAQPGVCHPIGDRYAVSLIPLVLLLAGDHRQRAADVLRATAIWLCDRYERDELGLAQVDAPAAEEIARVLGSALEHIDLRRRPTSQLAAVLLDLAVVLGLGELYADIRNDTLAVGLYPSVLLAADGSDWLSRTGFENRWEHNVPYAGELPEDGCAAPHLQPHDGPPLPRDRWWDGLAISAAVRDRHFPRVLRDAVALSHDPA